MKFLILVFALGLSVAQGLRAETQSQNDRAREFVSLLAETSHSVRQIVFLNSLAGATGKESMRHIAQDMNERHADSALASLEIRDDEFYVGGKKTGVMIFTYVPFELHFQKRKWTYDANLSAEKNYLHILEFLTNRHAKCATAANWMLPRAEAGIFGEIAELGGWYAGGAALGAVAGAVMVYAGIVTTPLWVAAGGMAFIGSKLGFGAGLLYMALRKGDPDIDKLLTLKFDPKCNGEEVRITMGGEKEKDQKTIVAKRPTNGKPEDLAILDAKGKPLDLSKVSAVHKKAITDALLTCKNDADAARAQREFMVAQKEVVALDHPATDSVYPAKAVVQ